MSTTKQGGQRREQPAITPTDALAMLASAISYCQQAGLAVEAGNVETGIVLVIGEAHIAINGNGPRFLAGNPTPELLALAPGDELMPAGPA